MESKHLNNDVTSKWSNSYRVEVSEKYFQDNLDEIELTGLIDRLISQNEDLHSSFENLFKNGDFNYVFKIILEEVKKDDKRNETGTYDSIIKYLEENNKPHIIDTLKSAPNIDPLIKNCLELAKGVSLNHRSLCKILDNISGEWKTVAKILNVDKDDEYEKYKDYKNTFRKWYNYKGFKDGPLELLTVFYLHSDVCLIDWESIQKVLQKMK
ncbi:uncharacterized protein LOC115219510 isoform X1 [Argonauta hians]